MCSIDLIGLARRDGIKQNRTAHKIFRKKEIKIMKGKKFLAGVLSAAMVLATMAFPVFADDEWGSNTIKVTNPTDSTVAYYDKWTAAINAVNAIDTSEVITVECKANAEITGGGHDAIKNSVKIEGNGAKLTQGDLTIEQDANGTLNKNISVSVDNLAGAAVWGTRTTTNNVDITVANCKDVRLILVHGTGDLGLTNITLDNCSFAPTDDATIYLKTAGKTTIKNCTFNNIGKVAVNIVKTTNGEQNVSITDCTFTNCATAAGSDYAAPIRLINRTTNGNVEAEIENCSISGTKATNGDVLLGDGRNGETSTPNVTLNISGTGAEIQVQEPGKRTTPTVKKTVKAADNEVVEIPAVAKINGKKYTSLKDAMQAANSNDTIDIVADITFDKVDGDYGKALINVTKDDNFNLTINGNGHKISTGVVLSQIDAQGAPYVPSISIKSNGGSLIVDNVVMPENLKFNIYGTEAVPADSLTIQNCTMNGSILDYMEATKNITYDNNNFAVNKNQYKTKDNVYPVWYKMQNKAAVESFTFTNNKVDFPRGIQLSHLPENMKIKVTGNTFDIHNEIREKNSALMIGAGQSADKQFKGKVVFSQNTVTAENGSALCIYSPSDNNTGFDFEAKSNIVAGGAKLVGYNIWSYNNTAEKEAAEALVNKVLKNVNGSENYADTIDIKFKPTSDERVYDIVLSGESKNINRFNAAEFTFSLDTTDKITYEIAAAEKMSLIPDHKNNKYEFHFDGKDDGVADTATEIKIGTVAFDGFGTFAFSAIAGKVTATTVADNLVTEFVTVAETGKGTLKISEDTNKIPETTISVPQHKLTINIAMNHPVKDNETAYQNMTVEISGGNLGTNTKKYALGIGGTELNNGIYTITADLDENGLYTVTVKGAGYRTARYTVALTEDKTMNLWNNVMTDKTIVVDDVEAKTNFLAGDIIKDGTINIYDLSAVVAYFNADKTMDTTKYEKLAKYDLNRDGKIDMMDISIVLTSWNN